MKDIVCMPIEDNPARKRVLDRIHLHAQVDTILVAAMEAGVGEDAFLEMVRAQWRDLSDKLDNAEALEALHVGGPRENPL